jgi:hypothetical protein
VTPRSLRQDNLFPTLMSLSTILLGRPNKLEPTSPTFPTIYGGYGEPCSMLSMTCCAPSTLQTHLNDVNPSRLKNCGLAIAPGEPSSWYWGGLSTPTTSRFISPPTVSNGLPTFLHPSRGPSTGRVSRNGTKSWGNYARWHWPSRAHATSSAPCKTPLPQKPTVE